MREKRIFKLLYNKGKVHKLKKKTKGRVQKKSVKKYGLLPNQGGGSARVIKKPHCFFEKKSIFQRVSRIILGPPTHVLHLILIDIFTAINIALKLAPFGKFVTL